MKNHFSNRVTSPLISISFGYVYITIISIIFYISGFYSKSTFFTWGIPINLMGTEINDYNTYYIILFTFFIHQLINNWINDVTYPWIINCIQDPKCTNLVYSKRMSMIIVNMFALYSELDVILIISGVMSQISFFLVIISANLVSVSITNWYYIRVKNDYKHNLLDYEEIV